MPVALANSRAWRGLTREKGVTARRQRGDQLAIAAAGRLEDDTDIMVERVEPGGDGIR